MTPTRNLNTGRIAARSIVVLCRGMVCGVIIALSFIGLMATAEAYGVGPVGKIGLGTFVLALTAGWALMNIQRWEASRKNDTGPKLIDRESEWEAVLHEHDDGYGIAARLVDGGVELRSFNDKDEVYNHTWVAGDELETVAAYLENEAHEDHL